jgi:hypothetical protein
MRGGTGGHRRAGLRVAALALLIATGCSSMRTVPLDRIPPQGRGKTRVVMRDGYTYQFARVTARGDSLTGTYFVTEERFGEDGNVTYEDVARQTVLPAARIERLESRHWDASKSFLLGAGGALFAIWLRGVLTQTRTETVEHGNPKPNPGLTR